MIYRKIKELKMDNLIIQYNLRTRLGKGLLNLKYKNKLIELIIQIKFINNFINKSFLNKI